MTRFLSHKYIALFSFLFLLVSAAFAADSDFPAPPNPPRLVNDFGGFLSAGEQQSLEYSLDSFNKVTSIEITIVTVKSLGPYDESTYAFELGNRWGVGKSGKNNGVLILASMDDRKIFIATGYGMEGVLPDGLLGRIYRQEMVPEFKQGDYYQGFHNAMNTIFLASKGEYKADQQDTAEDNGGGATAIIIVVLIILFVIFLIKRGGGGGGGNYMSRRGSDFITGAILGGLLGGGGRSSGGGFGGGSWGGGSSGGGGFGGFGGGSFGGGGAGGSY